VLDDDKGCYIFLGVLIQDSPFLFVNFYAPTKSSEQLPLFYQVANILKDFKVDPNCQIIIAADFNTDLDSNLDNLGCRIESKRTQRDDGCQ